MRVRARRNHRHEHAAALVVTLIVCTVLAIVVVALMQNTGLDRASSAGTTNHYRAKLAAESGASAAMATLADLITRYPDSVTVWQNIGGGAVNGTNNEATVLYFRASGANSNVGASPAAFGSQVGLWAMPLVSRTSAPTSLNTSPVALASIVNLVPLVSGVTTNLNATNSVYTEPFVGSRTTTNAGAPVTAGQWVYITQFGGPTNATNPYVARFAYWIEDESFKVNVNVAANGLRGTGSLGLGPDEIRIDGAWRASTNPSLANADAAATVADRSIFGAPGYPTVRSAIIPALGNNANIGNTAEFRFLTTTHSAGLDLSRGGFKRFDINELTRGGSSAYRLNADRFIAAITNTNSAPLFGQRFYRDTNNINAINTVASGPTPTAGNHALIYLNKLAANVIDYIDVDSQPTIFDTPPNSSVTNYFLRPVPLGGPAFGIEPLGGADDGSNSVAAIGVENVPRLQEYAVHARITKLDRIGYDTNSMPADLDEELEFSVDYYFEFWNPGIQDVTLPLDAYLQIFDQPSFENVMGDTTGINGAITNRSTHSYKIRLTNAVDVGTGLIYTDGIPFPAGSVTVLTTAPIALVNTNLLRGNSNNVISLAPSVATTNRLFASTVSSVINTAPTEINGTNYNRFFVVRSEGSHGDAHYLTSVLLASSNGILDSIRGLPITDRLTIFATNEAMAQSIGNVVGGNSLLVRGGGIRGNVSGLVGGRPKSTEGDARTINEQLEFRLHNTGSADATRFYDTDSSLTNLPSSSTIGFPNTNTTATIGVNPSVWADFALVSGGSASAPLVVRNAPIDSVAEFGHITDAARLPGTLGSLTNVVFSRGGGRTLRIGQPELPSWYDGNQTNASRTWTSWRLADIFTTTNAVTVSGLINPNGILRDRGMALRAALHGFTYMPSPNGAPNTAGTTLSSNIITTLVTNIVSRMTNTSSFNPTGSLNPFWERGEVSELSVLNTGTALLGGGINMSNTIDRGREELVRRSMQMLTTRGSIFTVYVIGQSIQVTGSITNVTSTARLRQVFQLEPMGLNTGDTFNPASAADISTRFSRPTGYDVRILSTSYD
jgi:hypothetical protein